MLLDYSKVTRITKKYNSASREKLYYEMQFAFIVITTLFILGMTKITILGSIAILRRLWQKLLKTNFFKKNQLMFNLLFGIYCLDALYVFCATIRFVSISSQLLLIFQLIMYFYVSTKHQKGRHFTLENSLKNIMVREIDLAYIYAIVYLEQTQSINQLILIVCFMIQLFIFQMTQLINQRGEQLQQRAKALSVWIKLTQKPQGDFVNWSSTQEKYPPNVTVQYNNNYYILQNLYNTSPPEDLKAIFIQLLFYNLHKTKQRFSIILIIVSIIAIIIEVNQMLFDKNINNLIVTENKN